MAWCMEVNLYENHQGVTFVIRLYVLRMGIIQ